MVNTRSAIDKEHSRFSELDNGPKLAWRKRWVETRGRGSYIPGREQIGKKTRSTAMPDGDYGSAPDA
jgi:hypothetical protein